MPEHPMSRAVRRVVNPHDAGTEPDTALLDRWVQSRDHSAFELIVWRYGAMVLSVCRRVLCPTDAEDAFQAVFLVLAQKAATVARRGTLGGWLHRVAVRTSRAGRRRMARRPVSLEIDPESPTGGAASEWREVLDAELDRLPERFRQVLVLCYLQERTVEEAATSLGIARGTVLSRLLRGRERLRARLSRRGLVLPATLGGLALATDASAAWPKPHLVSATVEIASGKLASGSTGAITPASVELAREVLNAMWINAAKKMLLVSSIVVTLGLGLSWASPTTEARAIIPEPTSDLPPVNTVRPPQPARKPAEKPDPKKDLGRLKGEWVVVSLEMGGEKIPEATARKLGFAFTADKFTEVGKLAEGGGGFVVSDESTECPFTIDPAKRLAEIDFAFAEKEVAPGIYSFDGEELLLCIDYSRTARPTAFETKGQPAFALYRLKKSK